MWKGLWARSRSRGSIGGARSAGVSAARGSRRTMLRRRRTSLSRTCGPDGLSWGRPLESGSAVSWTTGRAARPDPPSTTSKSRLRKPWTLGAGGGPDQVSRHDVYFRPPREAMSENGPTVSRRGARHKGWVREEDEWTAVPGVASAQRPSRSVLEDREAGARSVEVRRRACSPSWNGGESVKRLVIGRGPRRGRTKGSVQRAPETEPRLEE